jgi:signal transduction histidine kinase/CheY-like chemotaxis protein
MMGGGRQRPLAAAVRQLRKDMQRRMFWFTVAFMLVMAPVFAGLAHAVNEPRVGWWLDFVLGYAGLGGIVLFAVRARDFRRALGWLHSLGFACVLWAAASQMSVSTSAFWWLSVIPLVVILTGMTRLGMLQTVIVVLLAVVAGVHDASSAASPVASLRLHAGVVLSTIYVVAYLVLAVRWRGQLQRALDAALQASAASVEAKGRFLANLSHEIRNPLAGVIGAAELLRSSRNGEAQREQLIAMQEQSAKALLSLINDMLDWAKLDAGKVDLQEDPFCLHALLLEVNHLFAVTAFNKGIELTSSCNPDVPRRFRGDAARIRQVLHNLVGNAVKFTGHGGVHLHLALEGEVPTPAAPADGRAWVRVEVADSGVGIRSDRLDSIFQAFSQADASVSRVYGGTGLGLAICRELATLMGGRLEVSSTLGQGSTFALVVPLTLDELAAPDVGQLAYDITVASTHPGLVRHVRCLLHAFGREPLVRHVLPRDAQELEGQRFVLVDEPLLASHDDADGWLASMAASGVRLAVLAPLTGAHARVLPPGVALLHKPLRPEALAELLGTEDVAVEPVPTDAADPNRPVRAHVLLCEDNPVNQVIVRAMLSELGADCAVAANGREALHALEGERFDLVLMDLAMPDVDGVEATRRWRGVELQRGLRRIPIVAITGSVEAEDLAACRAAGMDGSLTKPFDLDDLRAVLRRHAHATT